MTQDSRMIILHAKALRQEKMNNDPKKAFFQGMAMQKRMTTNNSKKGKEFEHDFLQYLGKRGYWAHFLNPAPDGSQPFDILAIRGFLPDNLEISPVKTSVMICAFDCKTLSSKLFNLNRAEQNQLNSFRLLNKQGVNNTYFIVKLDDGRVYSIASQTVERKLREGDKSIDMEEWANEHPSIDIK